ncbi:MAG: dihydrofolate reductase [Eudoraea sp.]|nr:dihydrofolate reductase [Eudoraea sp.]
MSNITLIAAAADNNAIGKDNDLLWHLPNDFKRFKALTTGHMIIMGRKTFESFPKPLPKRTHIIITRDETYTVPYPDCFIVHSLEEALQMVADEELAFIIGGGEIYTQSLPFSDTIELTRVHADYSADTYFPEIPEEEWTLVNEEHHAKDDKHAVAFTYQTYKRI